MWKLFRTPILVLAALIFLPAIAYLLIQTKWSGPVRVELRTDTPGLSLQHVLMVFRAGTEYDIGLLAFPNTAVVRDVVWPLPQVIHLTFDDSGGVNHELLVTGVPPQFQGKLGIVISKDEDYRVRLELEPVGGTAAPAPAPAPAAPSTN